MPYPGFSNLSSIAYKVLLMSFSAAIMANNAVAAQRTLAWDSNSEPHLAGYKLHYGETSRNYTSTVDVGNQTSHTVDNLQDGKTYYFAVTAYDTTRTVESGFSNEVSDTIPDTTPPDTTPPTVPSNLAAVGTSPTQIDLNWTASTDNVGVTNYRVERCGGAGCSNFAQVATLTETSLTDSGLTAGTTYRYRVRAVDAASNVSGYSNVATATTQTVTLDTEAPTVPSNLAAVGTSTTQINLNWTASTDNVGVTGYRVERCQGVGCSNFAQVATPTGTSFADAGLTAETTYRYRVRAVDAAGNLSAYSGESSATTQTVDTTLISLWDDATTPSLLTDPDTNAVELGVKFQSDVDGFITGIRFYKSSTNTGEHVGSLWSSDGTLLAQATFTNETASGWQQVNFATPVAITANTVYVASYHTNVGQYSVDEGYFALPYANGPLSALGDGESGGNGVYLYGPGGFPTNTYKSSNYWVDVVFTTSGEPALLEAGEVEVNHEWQRVTFTQSFVDPVVVAKPLSYNGSHPAVVRIRNVNATGFDIRVQEWDYLDGNHTLETVGYLVMESGSYTLEDGTRVEAGQVRSEQRRFLYNGEVQRSLPNHSRGANGGDKLPGKRCGDDPVAQHRHC